MLLTKLQRIALKRVYLRNTSIGNYKTFRRSVVCFRDYIMVPFAGMWLGIELDGYTHS